ncbi:glycoside hydrolase 43 family protein [Paenibacillus sp. FSL H8-0548]|uniref:glycoside hydrolase family 43 protein n=1 Tax=Paenibacillus sp. FSL H8-0548 TaxID=1920422 RepID=UPI00096D5296|nr:glycoside hydrolase family 43 protein [Paenibacillus sp. FSL H8-0548]OMF34573.1 glycoside hydrolase 43 family protein [Paenibacillus sp. FSL H8-0548]
MRKFQNPILSGFYPDPSAIRVGEDYYLVTSSFEFFPGVPIFHSKDLVNWRQLGHVLDRPSQLNLDGIQPSRGIWAPTIRYHNGIYYMITTFVDNEKECHNFYVTATDPAGNWSDPVWLDDAPGIDPSLFFDEDGKVYYTGNRVPPEGQLYPKHMDIWLQELDLASGRLVGPKTSIWQGALKVGHAQEGPHLYKIGSWYYLLIAEGGTGHTHAITIARSELPGGPYEGYKGNPILTHRHLGRSYPIVNVGHGELIETQKGDWWMLCLASRPYGGYYRNLGRETFLVPVIWEREWPVVSPGKGMVEQVAEAPDLPETAWPKLPSRDDFDAPELSPIWNFIRTPRDEFWSLSEHVGFLRLALKPVSMASVDNPSFVGRRQQHMSFRAETSLCFAPQEAGDTAGIALLQNADFQFRVEYGNFDGVTEIRLTQRRDGEESVLGASAYSWESLFLRVEARGQRYGFYWRPVESEQWQPLCEDADGTVLSTDKAGGFTGAYMGMYAAGAEEGRVHYADFDWFSYEPLDYD